jgi:hypothetical protein
MNIAAMTMTAVANAVMATIGITSAPNSSIIGGDRHV